MTHAPVLKIVDLDNDFLVCTDVCKEGLRGVLMQEGRVISYTARKLNEHEINYVTHDRVGCHSTCFKNVEALPPGKDICAYDRPLWVEAPV